MKKLFTMPKTSLKWAVTLLTITLMAEAAASRASEVLSPSSPAYGFSYEEWSAKWWQWNLGQSARNMKWVAAPPICEGPASRVRFLAGAPGSTTETRKITVSDDMPLFFTVLSVWVDNTGCSSNGLPEFTTFTAPELATQAAGIWSAVSETTCTIDGKPVAGLNDPTNTAFRVQAPAFSYTTAQNDTVLGAIYGVTCIAGNTTIYPAVADGVYIMLAPLSPGKHTIHYVGVVGPVTAPFVKEDITYEITVVRGLPEPLEEGKGK